MRIESYTAEDMAEKPNLGPGDEGRMAVEWRGGYMRWAHFLCPCGCGDQAMLSLHSFHDPHWLLTIGSDRKPTITPSVNKLDGCKSHYYITGGKVIWIGGGQ